jgi:predicted esterase YcpF (UPF0227 family)
MGAVSTKVTAFEVGAVDITSELNTVSMSTSWETIDVSTLGDGNKLYLIGQEDATVSLGGWWSAGANDAAAVVEGIDNSAVTPLKMYPEGKGTGKKMYSMNAWLTSRDIDAGGPNEAVAFSAEFQRTGATTVGTVA